GDADVDGILYRETAGGARRNQPPVLREIRVGLDDRGSAAAGELLEERFILGNDPAPVVVGLDELPPPLSPGPALCGIRYRLGDRLRESRGVAGWDANSAAGFADDAWSVAALGKAGHDRFASRHVSQQ